MDYRQKVRWLEQRLSLYLPEVVSDFLLKGEGYSIHVLQPLTVDLPQTPTTGPSVPTIELSSANEITRSRAPDPPTRSSPSPALDADENPTTEPVPPTNPFTSAQTDLNEVPSTETGSDTIARLPIWRWENISKNWKFLPVRTWIHRSKISMSIVLEE